jgi:hypothetical protein
LGEINPFFIASHFSELGDRWNIYDSDGIPHQIYYNRSISNPLITFGWPRLRNYYRWVGTIRLTFFYFGENSFLMVECAREGRNSPTTYPPFHSLSTNVGDYRSFRMCMSVNNVTSSHLVSFIYVHYQHKIFLKLNVHYNYTNPTLVIYSL